MTVHAVVEQEAGAIEELRRVCGAAAGAFLSVPREEVAAGLESVARALTHRYQLTLEVPGEAGGGEAEARVRVCSGAGAGETRFGIPAAG